MEEITKGNVAKDRISILNYFSIFFQDSISHLSTIINNEAEFSSVKTDLLHWSVSIERQMLHKKANELWGRYLESWIISTKFQYNGNGWLRTNYNACCSECYYTHRIYLEFDQALEIMLYPYDKCINRFGCVCEYVWKSKDEPIKKHPWFPNSQWRLGDKEE